MIAGGAGVETGGTELVVVGVHEISELGHELAALSAWAVETPSRVERLARGLDSTVDV